MDRDRVYSFDPSEFAEEELTVKLGDYRHPFNCEGLNEQHEQPTIVSREYLLESYDMFRVELVNTSKEPLKNGVERSLFRGVPPHFERRLCVYMDVNSFDRNTKDRFLALRCSFEIGGGVLESIPRSVERGIVFDKWMIVGSENPVAIARRVPIYKPILRPSRLKMENGLLK